MTINSSRIGEERKSTEQYSKVNNSIRTCHEKELKHANERLKKMCGAVRTLLECIGEDPDREGLLNTPLRYAKALLCLTKGYDGNVHDIAGNALFREGHRELVIVKGIDICSTCEHHLLPFTGKVYLTSRIPLTRKATKRV